MSRIFKLNLGACFSAALLCLLTAATGAQQASQMSNGSFEEGEMEPIGWHMHGDGRWTRGEARSGLRSVGGANREGGVVWSGDPIKTEQGQSYRLGGWINTRRGAARLEVELLDVGGKALGSTPSAPVKPADTRITESEWQYVAVEWDSAANATHARVRLWVRGEAYLDDVTFAPLISNVLFNPSFDPVPNDRRQRVQFWDEDRGFDADPHFEMNNEKGGSHRADTEGGRGGSALHIDAARSWWAVRNIAATLPPGVTTYRFSGWVRSVKNHANAPEPEIRVVWLDRNERVLLRTPAQPVQTQDEWTRYELAPARPPQGAERATISVAAIEGEAWFDDFDFRAVEPVSNRRPVIEVHANQVGYEESWPKSVVVATNFFPETAVNAVVDVISDDGRRVMRVPLVARGRIHDGLSGDWGAYYWRADFSELSLPGAYRAVARIGEAWGESPRFLVGRNVLFEETVGIGCEFFFVQRCGFEVFGWHKACHLDDARLPDGTHIDATGGWHSAGDYNKLMYENGDGGCSYALLGAFRSQPGYFADADRDHDGVPDILDEARWGADFVAKMQVPETGALRKDVRQGPGRRWHKWSPPEVHTDNIVGTDDDPVIDEGEGSSPLMIGGWARLSALLGERGIETDYLSRAVRLWNHVTVDGTAGYGPHPLMSGLDLYEITGEVGYLDFARRSVGVMLESQVAEGRRKGAFGGYGEYTAGALAVFALSHPDDALTGRIRTALLDYLAFCVSTADNPFGLAKQMVGEPEFFFEPSSSYGHNFEIFARAWAAALIYRLTGDRRAAEYAADQIDWVFGKNPYGLCMMEGAGTVNPPRYHHRYDSIPGHERGAVPGAIPNGFVRSVMGLDQPGFDMTAERSTRRRPSYRTSEPWLVHNMWHLLAVTEVSRAAAGDRGEGK